MRMRAISPSAKNTSNTTESVGTIGVKPVKTAKVASAEVRARTISTGPALMTKRRARPEALVVLSSSATFPVKLSCPFLRNPPGSGRRAVSGRCNYTAVLPNYDKFRAMTRGAVGRLAEMRPGNLRTPSLRQQAVLMAKASSRHHAMTRLSLEQTMNERRPSSDASRARRSWQTQRGRRMSLMSSSRTFLRKVLRLRPSISAALIWLPAGGREGRGDERSLEFPQDPVIEPRRGQVIAMLGEELGQMTLDRARQAALVGGAGSAVRLVRAVLAKVRREARVLRTGQSEFGVDQRRRDHLLRVEGGEAADEVLEFAPHCRASDSV